MVEELRTFDKDVSAVCIGENKLAMDFVCCWYIFWFIIGSKGVKLEDECFENFFDEVLTNVFLTLCYQRVFETKHVNLWLSTFVSTVNSSVVTRW